MLIRPLAACRRSVSLVPGTRSLLYRSPVLQTPLNAALACTLPRLRRSDVESSVDLTEKGLAQSLPSRTSFSGLASKRRYGTNSTNTKPVAQKSTASSSQVTPSPNTSTPPTTPELRESPYTIPNALTLARILSCPVLGYCVVKGEFEWATGILVLGGFSDWLDGYIARRFNMRSVFGTILDPAADKTLMTTLVVTLAYKGLLPMPLAVLILGRDVALSLSAFYYRYISLPEPKTFKRYWDFSIPSAEVRPTQISKYNTALQLVLMGTTTVSPLLGVDISVPLQALQWTVAGTTIWSGLSYIGSKDAVKILSKK